MLKVSHSYLRLSTTVSRSCFPFKNLLTDYSIVFISTFFLWQWPLSLMIDRKKGSIDSLQLLKLTKVFTQKENGISHVKRQHIVAKKRLEISIVESKANSNQFKGKQRLIILQYSFLNFSIGIDFIQRATCARSHTICYQFANNMIMFTVFTGKILYRFLCPIWFFEVCCATQFLFNYDCCIECIQIGMIDR